MLVNLSRKSSENRRETLLSCFIVYIAENTVRAVAGKKKLGKMCCNFVWNLETRYVNLFQVVYIHTRSQLYVLEYLRYLCVSVLFISG